jgi:L-lysine exporter family protein LysE/ArgO
MFYSQAFFAGFGTSLGLIAAIGAQNAYVLKQGILRNHIFAVASICLIYDAVLIILGVAGFGILLSKNESIMTFTKWAGVLFLSAYGIKSFRSALANTGVLNVDNLREIPSFKRTFFTLTAVTFLNPHVYIDTCLLVGTIGANFPADQRITYTTGAIFASFIWFFSLSYLGKTLAPLFEKRISWQILETLTGVLMLTIATMLLIKF